MVKCINGHKCHGPITVLHQRAAFKAVDAGANYGPKRSWKGLS